MIIFFGPDTPWYLGFLDAFPYLGNAELFLLSRNFRFNPQAVPQLHSNGQVSPPKILAFSSLESPCVFLVLIFFNNLISPFSFSWINHLNM